MSEEQIYAALTHIFRDVLGNPALVLHSDLRTGEIKGWDSFAHVNIIVASEARFDVRIRASEAQGLKDISDFVRLIQLKSTAERHVGAAHTDKTT
jgi:acyl carrier protein